MWAIILFWVLVIAVIFLSLPTTCNAVKEGFYTLGGYYKRYCPSCGDRSRHGCSKCTNCGYCITASGNGECAPGDSSGPYFRSDCMYWEYGSDSFYYPYRNYYPLTRTKTLYPYRRRGRVPYRYY